MHVHPVHPPPAYASAPAHSFYLFPCLHNGAQLEIDKLSTSKATGPYSFPAAMIKILKLVISKPLETTDLQFFISLS